MVTNFLTPKNVAMKFKDERNRHRKLKFLFLNDFARLCGR